MAHDESSFDELFDDTPQPHVDVFEGLDIADDDSTDDVDADTDAGADEVPVEHPLTDSSPVDAGGDDFVHLHTHLETSMLDGASRIPDAVMAAASLGQSALAITDHGRLGGTWKFVQECQKAGIKPILGMEAYVALGSRFEKNEITVPGDDPTADGQKTKRYEHLTLLAATAEGWRNLVAMHNASHESFWYYPRIDYDLMAEHSAGIIALTGCLAGPVLGPVARWVASESLRELSAEQAAALQPSVETARADVANAIDKVRLAVKEATGTELGKDTPSNLLRAALLGLGEEHTETVKLIEQATETVERYEAVREKYKQLVHEASDHELDAARENLQRLVDTFGRDNVYVEVMEHGIEFESAALAVVAELAAEFDLPLVATNDSHYVHEHDAEAHDAWLALQAGSGDKARVDNPDRFRFNGEGYFIRSGEQMRALRSEDWWQRAVDNAAVVAARIEPDVLPERYMRLPTYPTPDGFTDSAAYFRHLVKQGTFAKYGDNPSQEVRDRLNYEVRTITSMGLHDYFLIVQDVINWARSDYIDSDWIARENGQDIDDTTRERKKPILVGPGRGSAAGSAVSYVLGIVGLDPIRFDLIFERFLDPTRVGMPDVDVDFERDRRAEVLAYLVHRWGRDKVAHIGAFAKAKTRQAIKNAARVLGVSPAMQNRLTKAVPLIDGKFPSVAVLTDTSRTEGAVLREVLDEIDTANPDAAQPLSERIVFLATAFEDLTSGEGVHACGMLLANEPMTQMVPLRLDHKKDADPDAPAIALWDGKDVDSFGLLKLDVLGLRTLDLISAALAGASRLAGREITIEDIPDGDDHDAEGVAETWRLLQEGRTAGVFQLESSGMTELTENVAPDSLEDLSALVALYRPGPLSAGMHTHYADRKNGREAVDYGLFTDDPAETEVITDVLGSTYGLNVYQEQSMLLGQKVAGFGAPLTNRLRKAISKKNEAEFPELGRLFVEGAMKDRTEDGEAKLAFSQRTAELLWDSIKGSAAYAFNKAHSAAYGYIGYQTAWIKANYPSAFGAGLLSVTSAAEKRHATLASLREQGIEVLPPDVNVSLASTSALDERTIIIGLSEIKGVGSIAEALVTEREVNGPFSNTADLVRRVPDLPSDKVAALAEAGALDAFGPRLGQVMVARALRDRPDTDPADAEWGVLERWVRQHELLGLAVGDYPLLDDSIQAQVTDFQNSWVEEIRQDPGASDYAAKPAIGLTNIHAQSSTASSRTIGLVSAWSTRPLQRGVMANLVLENSRARYDAVAWPTAMNTMDPSVGMGSIVQAYVVPRVREITTEDDEGDVTVVTKTELEVKSLQPIDVDDSPRRPQSTPPSFDLAALCVGSSGQVAPTPAPTTSPPEGLAQHNEARAPEAPPSTPESVRGQGLDMALTVEVDSFVTADVGAVADSTRFVSATDVAGRREGLYCVSGAWGTVWLRVLDEYTGPPDAHWDPPRQLWQDRDLWEATEDTSCWRLQDDHARPYLQAGGSVELEAAA